MHIEIDVLEGLVLLFSVYAFKWLFRLIVLGIVAKVIGEAKNKAKGAIEDVQRQFSGHEQTRQDAQHDHFEPHITSQDVTEFVRNDPLQFIPPKDLHCLLRDADDSVAVSQPRRERIDAVG